MGNVVCSVHIQTEIKFVLYAKKSSCVMCGLKVNQKWSPLPLLCIKSHQTLIFGVQHWFFKINLCQVDFQKKLCRD